MSCRHDVRRTEHECLYSPSHWSASSKSPDLVIETFVTKMWSCYQENLLNVLVQEAIPYGDGKQVIDIWGDEVESAAAIALFHGGYWQEGDRKLFTSPVKALTDEGIVVACVGYDFATTICLNDVMEEATKALHVSENLYLFRETNHVVYLFAQFLAKRWPLKQLSIGGHSAGAHLAISALKRVVDAHRYEKVVLFSGIYDLHPLLDTYIGEAINLAEAEALSIVRLDDIAAELLVVVGAEESPKFKEQSQRIVESYVEKRNGIDMSHCYKVILGEDHFTLITSLADKNSTTTQEFLHFMLRK
uniref:Abhydrolase_3 domain-containing protein n=1 Tax=Elaeophora elaphi TaxID=1147741 RepID=A0A0R3S3I0_9BILA